MVLVLAEGAVIIGLGTAALGGVASLRSAEEVCRALFQDAMIRKAFGGGIIVAGFVGLTASVTATISAVQRHMQGTSVGTFNATGQSGIVELLDGRPYAITDAILLLPLLMPPLLTGIAAASLQRDVFGVYGSSLSVIVAHTITFGPLSYFIIVGTLGRLPAALYQAAVNLRIAPLKYVVGVLLPVLAMPVLMGGLLCFSFSLNDHSLARYVGGTFLNAGTLIADKQVSGMEPKYVCAVALVMVTTLLCLIAFAVMASLAPGYKRHTRWTDK